MVSSTTRCCASTRSATGSSCSPTTWLGTSARCSSSAQGSCSSGERGGQKPKALGRERRRVDADCSTAHDHEGLGGASALWPLVLVSLGVGYVLAVRRVRRRGRTWSALRTAAFLAGLLLVALGVSGPLAESGARDLR